MVWHSLKSTVRISTFELLAPVASDCRLTRLLVSVEGLKVVEIEKCKNDLKKLRDEMTSRGGGR